MKYRLGQALVQLASDTVMFFCCESGGERISRHNALRDALFDTAVAASLGPTKEGGKVLLPGNDRRPAEISVPHWSNGKDAARRWM